MDFKREKRRNRHRPQDELRTLIRRARELVNGLDAATFNRRPPDGGWSVGECLDHLNATARLYIPVFADTIEDARSRGLLSPPAPGRSLLGRLVVWATEPPPRRFTRMRTTAALEPARDLDPAATLDDFEALHEELIVRMNEAADLDLRKIKLASVIDPRVRLSLGDWFAFLPAHARRHLWQADRALEALKGARTSQ